MKTLVTLFAGFMLGAFYVVATKKQRRLSKPKTGGRLAVFWNIPYSRN